MTTGRTTAWMLSGAFLWLAGAPWIGMDASAQELTQAQICKAVLAAMNGRDPRDITTETGASEVSLRYVRKSDGTPWAYRCVIQDGRVFLTLADQEFNFDNSIVTRRVELDAAAKRLKVVETFKGEEDTPIETWVNVSDLGSE